MSNTSEDSASSSPDSHPDSGLDKSLVGKLVSGLINRTPLSKWFGGQEPKPGARRRDDDDDDPSYSLQPPNKRAKLPGSYNLYGSPIRSSSAPITHSAPPSGFPEPMAGPSGLQSRRIRERTTPAPAETINGVHDSDSEESSGYCSAPVLNKQTKPAESAEPEPVIRPRSLFTTVNDSRSLFSSRPSPNASLSSRRPNFDASIIGSPKFVDKTLSTRRILSSPFYSGRTTYGGASAYGRKFGSTNDLNQSVRSSIQIKPISRKATSETTALSKTARRILNTLEMYSTPVSDAKKIPVPERRQDSLLSRYVGASPYVVRDRKRPSNRELQVPDLLQMKQKERLQNSTENMRQMATSSKSTLNQEEYRLRTDDDPKQKHTNKMKSKSVLKTKAPPVVQPPSPTLVFPVAPLQVNQLPKFGLLFAPPPKELKEALIAKAAYQPPKLHNFSFSAPLVLSKKIPNLRSENSFKFTVPPVVDSEMYVNSNSLVQTGLKSATVKVGEKIPTVKSVQVQKANSPKVLEEKNPNKCSCLVRNNKTDASCNKCCAGEASGALPARGFGDQFKAPSSTWECTTCLVRNKEEAKTCVACQTNRSTQSNQANKVSSNSFGDKFKEPADTWECSACLIRNKADVDKCVACETAKVVPAPAAPSFGDKFKAASDTWECPTCMIRNKTEDAKCVACETAKPGQKTNLQFGMLPAEWECKTCLIKNKYLLAKCAACEATREASIGFGDSFKMKGGEWSCDSCMVKNQSEVTVCVCCGVAKPGAQSIAVAEKKPIVSFNFGIDKAQSGQFQFGVPADKQEAKPILKIPSFGSGATTEEVPVSTGFSFGAKRPVPTTDDEPEVVAASTGFSFGAKRPVPTTDDKHEQIPASTGFSFGAKRPVPTTDDEPKVIPASTGFSFGAKPAGGKPEAVPASTFGAKPEASPKVVPKAASPATSTFGAKANSDPKVLEAKLNPLLRPGEKLPEKAIPAPPDFSFGKPPAMANTGKLQPLFSGPPVNGDLSRAKAVYFGSPPKPTEPTINFNAPKPEFAAPTFKFDPKAMNTPPAASFSFGAKAPEKVPFKFEPPKLDAAAPMFQFAAKPAEAASPNMFKFGKRPAEATNGFGAKMAAFGNGPSAESKPFGFGEAPKAVVPMSQEAKPNNSGVFGFGAASTMPAAPAGFNYGPSPATGFNFGSNGSAATKNGNFNFGSSANGGNQKAIFSFGAGQTNAAGFNAAAPVQQPFKFAPTATPVAAVPTPPTDGFNFTGAPPSFNFTDGSAGGQPQRKIRKALRRTQR